jgi:hypothetical protein
MGIMLVNVTTVTVSVKNNTIADIIIPTPQ